MTKEEEIFLKKIDVIEKLMIRLKVYHLNNYKI